MGGLIIGAVAVAGLMGTGFFGGMWARSELDDGTPAEAAASSAVKVAGALFVLWIIYTKVNKKRKE